MAPETMHFLEAVVYDRAVMVTPEHARMVMEVYIAADLSAERNEPVTLPLQDAAALRKQPKRIGLAIIGAGPRRVCSAAKSPRATRWSTGSASPTSSPTARSSSATSARPTSSPPTSANC